MIGIDTATRLTGLTKTLELANSQLYKLHVGFVGRYMQNAPDPVLDKDLTIDEIYELAELRTKNEYGEVGESPRGQSMRMLVFGVPLPRNWDGCGCSSAAALTVN